MGAPHKGRDASLTSMTLDRFLINKLRSISGPEPGKIYKFTYEPVEEGLRMLLRSRDIPATPKEERDKQYPDDPYASGPYFSFTELVLLFAVDLNIDVEDTIRNPQSRHIPRYGVERDDDYHPIKDKDGITFAKNTYKSILKNCADILAQHNSIIEKYKQRIAVLENK